MIYRRPDDVFSSSVTRARFATILIAQQRIRRVVIHYPYQTCFLLMRDCCVYVQTKKIITPQIDLERPACIDKESLLFRALRTVGSAEHWEFVFVGYNRQMLSCDNALPVGPTRVPFQFCPFYRCSSLAPLSAQFNSQTPVIFID